MNKPVSNLVFSSPVNDEDLMKVYNFNVEVFTDTTDFNWTLDNIKKELKDGWKLYSVKADDNQIIAAVFLKNTTDALLTKSTPVKIEYQGNGYSHKIKEFIEDMAKKNKARKIINYCRRDNFRMISLNETHGYAKTGKVIETDQNLIEWEKSLK
jgi:hypothetical protein